MAQDDLVDVVHFAVTNEFEIRELGVVEEPVYVVRVCYVCKSPKSSNFLMFLKSMIVVGIGWREGMLSQKMLSETAVLLDVGSACERLGRRMRVLVQ